MASSSSAHWESPDSSRSHLIFHNYDSTAASLDAAYADHGLFTGDYKKLLQLLADAEENPNFPKNFKKTVLVPFIQYLLNNEDTFKKIIPALNSELTAEEVALKLTITCIAEALLHRNPENYPQDAFEDLEAFQSIVSAIHQTTADLITDGSFGSIPAMAVWSQAKGRSPYAITMSQKVREAIGVKTGIVCLPPHYRHAGILAWSTLGHEVGGHHFIGSHPGIIEVFKKTIQEAIATNIKPEESDDPSQIKLIANHLSERVNELASDVLSTLQTGPSSAIGFIGYMRGIRGGLMETKGPYAARETRTLTLSWGSQSLTINPLQKPLKQLGQRGVIGKVAGEATEVHYEKTVIPGDPHPIDVLRPYAMLEVIQLLNIEERLKQAWKNLIEQEMQRELKDIKAIHLFTQEPSLIDSSTEGHSQMIDIELAIKATGIAAKAISEVQIEFLEDKSLKELVNWGSKDEFKVAMARRELTAETFTPGILIDLDARHILAGGILASMEKGADLKQIFSNMKKLLVQYTRSGTDS